MTTHIRRLRSSFVRRAVACVRRRFLILGTSVALVLVHGATASAARGPARMQLPEGLEAVTERFETNGYGGRNRGAYTLGPYSGEFTRIESRWAVFDPLVATSRGKSSFTVAGPGIEALVSATCEMKQRSVTIGVMTFDPKKLVYECGFETAGAGLDASFVLGQPKPENLRARLLALSDRRGELVVEGLRLAVHSVHRYAGSKLQSPTPVGYVIERDGRAIGAIELTDVDPAILLPRAESLETRRATLLAVLALSVLRDPAESDLGE